MDHKYVYSWVCAYEHLLSGWTCLGNEFIATLKTGEMVWGIDDEDGCGDFPEDRWNIYDYIDSEPEPLSYGCWLRSPIPEEMWANPPAQYYL